LAGRPEVAAAVGGCHRPDVLLDPDLVAAARVGLWLAVCT
jgi:hypothetical protein